MYQLNPSQSLAWHSPDAEEREAIRREIRAAALARLSPHSTEAVIVDFGGAELERLAAPARP